MFEVIIIGGSYSGLSAGMALGRALRNVLIIDAGQPCNQQTPHSHNFITQDGKTPKEISQLAKQQVEKYDTVKFYDGLVVNTIKTSGGFEITTNKKDTFLTEKIIFATGIKDIMPNIKGFASCWGISVIHCPYCHGYEVKNIKTGILANGNNAFHYAQLISNWTKDLTVFTNGKSTLTVEQTDKIKQHNIAIIEKEVIALEHINGKLKEIIFTDNSSFELKALYARPEFKHHTNIPEKLGCELTEHGLLKVDMFQKTTVKNILACGDNASLFRSVSVAVASGNMAGAFLNNQMTEKEF
ncbi:NAD(P)/FAD-dependent oxidoreductase [Cellulophaga baltica]|uniref:NAD(P)/FAD-dependent oxidoreductase n=1 Tax=Cellulophaga TaxID=104264 RepID=UPI001C07AC65|nr:MULTISPECIES: NAD(P)/FAD-dependent oxidoreductase [Cellulophaga]MBU2995305.1 NAD(P)/FAD-dependent oxidoreductase [Cellulophaga baltica]MDO6766700.1 NAD(P)/FAD-dependent oxidoreductase [Cellulophaga sp. 1_MG-2023]